MHVMSFAAPERSGTSMRHLVVLTACSLAAAPALLVSPVATAADKPTPSFNSTVGPILYQHCASCHREGGSMPAITLDSYESAKAASSAIREQIMTRKMPPWFADSKQSLPMRNDMSLSDTQIAAL